VDARAEQNGAFPHGPGAGRHVRARVTDYLEDALDGPARGRFEQHVAGCRACAVHLEQMRSTVAALGSLGRPRLPDDVRDRLLRAFRGPDPFA